MKGIISLGDEIENGKEYETTHFADGSVMRIIKLGAVAEEKKTTSLETIMTELQDIRSALETAGLITAKEKEIAS